MAKDNKDYLDNLRHSAAHLLAAAVMELYPGALRTIGPAIENGFYFDFDNLKISEDDLPKIEAKMQEILPTWRAFERQEVSVAEAKEAYADNPYKLELIDEFAGRGETLTFYHSGNYFDLCRGGHIENPAEELKHFKLLKIAGAYWRGSEDNKMLTRIYGTIFPTKEELENHLKLQKLAEERDHRKLGQDLQLFAISDAVGPGLILWLPKGNLIKEEIESWAKETEKAWGYIRVTTPNITKSGLFETSGHLPYYKDDMYPPMTLEDGTSYYLKPMNCPFHHMIFQSKTRSYRELPLRLAEYGTCYRYEASGELFGLMRVRGFTQNDSHIYCTEDQAVDEFVKVMQLHEYYYQALGIKEYHLELALRDPSNTKKYHGNEDMWAKAEDLMRQAVARTNIPMVEKKGSAAFYGPKIDFIIHSSIGREFGISTNQIDLYMGPRFGLKYADRSGEEKIPVIIHRAPLGSHERFIGFLIEHYGGAFPTWLAPVQTILLPIADRHQEAAQAVQAELEAAGLRVDLDDRQETLGAKIRDAQTQKVPYMIIIGDKEKESGKLSVRSRDKGDLGSLELKNFLDTVRIEVQDKLLVSAF